MYSGGSDVFSSMEQDIKYEGCIDEGRAYLAAGRYDETIEAAKRARGYLKKDADTSEVDDIEAAARSALERIEQDKRELAEREERERARAAEQERLAREQAERRARQAAQDEQKRQQEKKQEEEKSKNLRSGIIRFVIATAFLVPTFLYITSLSGEWYGKRNIEIAFLTAFVMAIGPSIYMIIAGGASDRVPGGLALLWTIFIAFVVLLMAVLLGAEHGDIEIPGVIVGLLVPITVFGFSRM